MSLLSSGALSPSFAGHSTFALRAGWLKKGVDALRDEHQETSIFNRPEAIVELGVGKNMVGAIRHWLLVTGMAGEESRGRALQVSPLGERLLADDGWDPFLEDDATLWLLHWKLAGPRSAAFTWTYAFNEWRDGEFSRESLVDALASATHSLAKPPSRETLDRDVACFLQTYVADERSVLNDDSLDCPLRALGLVRAAGRGRFRFAQGAKPTLPRAVFAFALAEFWNWKFAETRALSVWDICHAAGSPGRAFKLDEDGVLAFLDGIEEVTEGLLRFEDTAQSRQVVRPAEIPDALSVLRLAYESAVAA